MTEYLQKIDATLEPFGGSFLVHGSEVEIVENSWPGHLIVIEFPDRNHARAWYHSPAYQAILALRTDNSGSDRATLSPQQKYRLLAEKIPEPPWH